MMDEAQSSEQLGNGLFGHKKTLHDDRKEHFKVYSPRKFQSAPDTESMKGASALNLVNEFRSTRPLSPKSRVNKLRRLNLWWLTNEEKQNDEEYIQHVSNSTKKMKINTDSHKPKPSKKSLFIPITTCDDDINKKYSHDLDIATVVSCHSIPSQSNEIVSLEMDNDMIPIHIDSSSQQQNNIHYHPTLQQSDTNQILIKEDRSYHTTNEVSTQATALPTRLKTRNRYCQTKAKPKTVSISMQTDDSISVASTPILTGTPPPDDDIPSQSTEEEESTIVCSSTPSEEISQLSTTESKMDPIQTTPIKTNQLNERFPETPNRHDSVSIVSPNDGGSVGRRESESESVLRLEFRETQNTLLQLLQNSEQRRFNRLQSFSWLPR